MADKNSVYPTFTGRVSGVKLDVTSDESVAEAARHVRAVCDRHAGGALWSVVNNAGVFSFGPTEWESHEAFAKVFEVNVHGPRRCALACLPLLRAGAGTGRVVNVCSIVSHQTCPFSTAYCASKAAVRAFSDGLRRELAFAGAHVSVHCIEPGFHKTNLLAHDGMRRMLDAAWAAAPQEARDAYGGKGGKSRMLACLPITEFFSTVDIGGVVKALEHAATARTPREVYAVGWDTHTVWRLVGWLPVWLEDVLYLALGRLMAGAAPRGKGGGVLAPVVVRQLLAHVLWSLALCAALWCCFARGSVGHAVAIAAGAGGLQALRLVTV